MESIFEGFITKQKDCHSDKDMHYGDLGESNIKINLNSKPEVDKTVILNVGGQHHEVMLSTLLSRPKTLFTDKEQLLAHYRQEQNEFFFDRNPHLFHYILNYFRIGELHAPAEVCGPMFRKELCFWGIDEYELQDCCWTRYCSDLNTRALLKHFEEEQVQSDDCRLFKGETRWIKFRKMACAFFENPHSSTAAKIYGCISMLLILTSISVFCAETHPSLFVNLTEAQYSAYYQTTINRSADGVYYELKLNENGTTWIKKMVDPDLIAPNPILVAIDIACCVYFSFELLIRFTLSQNKLKFFTKLLNIFDLVAILPFYIERIVQSVHHQQIYHRSVVDVLFSLQILRIFRVFRLMRHVKGIKVLAYTLGHSWRELVLLVVFLLIGMLMFGSLIYFAEYKSQRIQSIPHGFWWAIVTMTTVGYGDMYPITDWGYAVGSVCSITGVLVIAFSVPSLVNNFMLFYNFIHYDKLNKTITKDNKTKKIKSEKYELKNKLITLKEIVNKPLKNRKASITPEK